jgi:hypothetical protein
MKTVTCQHRLPLGNIAIGRGAGFDGTASVIDDSKQTGRRKRIASGVAGLIFAAWALCGGASGDPCVGSRPHHFFSSGR